MNGDKQLLAGKWEINFGKVLIPAQILGDITPNYEEGTLEVETQAGTRKQPTGKATNAELAFTMYISELEQLKSLYNLAGTDAMVFGGGSCMKNSDGVAVHVHHVCDGKDAKNDIHIYKGIVTTKFNPSLSTKDALSIEATIQMQPTDQGYMLLGYPDPKTPQYWDATAQAWKAKPSTP